MKEQAAVLCCDECHHTDSYIHVNTDSFKKFVGRKKPPVGGLRLSILVSVAMLYLLSIIAMLALSFHVCLHMHA